MPPPKTGNCKISTHKITAVTSSCCHSTSTNKVTVVSSHSTKLSIDSSLTNITAVNSHSASTNITAVNSHSTLPNITAINSRSTSPNITAVNSHSTSPNITAVNSHSTSPNITAVNSHSTSSGKVTDVSSRLINITAVNRYLLKQQCCRCQPITQPPSIKLQPPTVTQQNVASTNKISHQQVADRCQQTASQPQATKSISR